MSAMRMRVGRGLRLGEQGGALLVGGEHHLDERLGPARRLLRDPADARAARHGERTRGRARSRR